MSLLSFIDDALEAVFHRKGPDASKARAKAIKTIDTASRQFASTEPTRGRKVWRASNNVVAFEPGYKVEGRKIAHIPSERFAEFLTKLRSEIETGNYDKALLADGVDDAPVKTRKQRSETGEPRKQRPPRDPAATARALATRAANKAKKLGEAAKG